MASAAAAVEADDAGAALSQTLSPAEIRFFCEQGYLVR